MLRFLLSDTVITVIVAIVALFIVSVAVAFVILTTMRFHRERLGEFQ